MSSINTERALADVMGVKVDIKQVIINGYNINYVVVGAGEPLLLIHGANFGWGVWYPNIVELTKHFTVYAIDLPGAGRSSRIDYSGLNLERDFVNIIQEFINYHNFRKIDIVGSSIGGWLALRMALQNPQKIQKIVLENAVGFADYWSFSDKIIGFYPFAKLITKTVLKPKRKNKRIEKFLRSIFYDPNIDLSKEFIDYFYETMESSHNLLFISSLTKHNKDFLLVNQLKKIKNKTLIFWGAHDKIMPLEKNEINFKLLPNSQVEIIQEAAHIPSIEKSEYFNSKVIRFLLEK